jgi:acid phosphatase type 7
VLRGGFIAVLALSSVVLAATGGVASGASNMLPNGGFDGSGSGSTAGWRPTNATLTVNRSGPQAGAASVVVSRSAGTTYGVTRATRPVLSTAAGNVYAAGGWVRAAGGSKRVCLYLREYTGTVLVKSVPSCLTVGRSWQRFSTAALTAVNSGDSMNFAVSQSSAAAGDSFELDSASLVLVSSDPVIAAAGDIACDPANGSFRSGLGTTNACRQMATSNLLADPVISSILTLGDNQYTCGAYDAFMASFDPSWGRFRAAIHPVPGNHEYEPTAGTNCDATGMATGYYTYFGAAAGDPAKGYYSYDIGSWHIVALNSNCAVVSCAAGSPQVTWLSNDLATHPTACTLAYWHHPRFSSGAHGSDSMTAPFWDALAAAHADVVLVGHDHDYERFAPQSPAGGFDPIGGIREFVVGTGGAGHYTFPLIRPNSERRNATTFGILELTLHPSGYDWQFVPEAGQLFSDNGTAQCT